MPSGEFRKNKKNKNLAVFVSFLKKTTDEPEEWYIDVSEKNYISTRFRVLKLLGRNSMPNLGEKILWITQLNSRSPCRSFLEIVEFQVNLFSMV